MKRFTCFFFFLLFFIAPASAAKKLKVHILTYDCTVTKQQRDSIEKVVQYETAFYRDIFKGKHIPVIRIKIYGDRAKFKKTLPVKYRARPVAGYYTTRTKEVYVYKNASFLSTCYHETSHLILHSFSGQHPPTWLNEGLATYFENARLDSLGNVFIPQDTLAAKKIQYRYNYRSPKPERYFRLSPFRFYRRPSAPRNYAMSWAMVNFMMTRHETIFRGMIWDICAGHKAKGVIEEKFPGGMAAFEKELARYYD